MHGRIIFGQGQSGVKAMTQLRFLNILRLITENSVDTRRGPLNQLARKQRVQSGAVRPNFHVLGVFSGSSQADDILCIYDGAIQAQSVFGEIHAAHFEKYIDQQFISATPIFLHRDIG
ncbi:hypothetical protein CXF97_12740 [Pseudomonas sp. Choline-02u-1]|nr:hypothetical protein CXF97_12740 [Pseudomonas sp. Choline-02u-1]